MILLCDEDYCEDEAEVTNSEGSYCQLHSKCDECGRDEMQVGRHCFNCAAGIMCDELGLQERLAA